MLTIDTIPPKIKIPDSQIPNFKFGTGKTNLESMIIYFPCAAYGNGSDGKTF